MGPRVLISGTWYYTITVGPSTRPGKVTAHSSDGHSLTTSTPLLDGARQAHRGQRPFRKGLLTPLFCHAHKQNSSSL